MCALVALLTLVIWAPPASAFLSEWDPNDTDVRLDISRVSSFTRVEYLGLGVRFHEGVVRRRKPPIAAGTTPSVPEPLTSCYVSTSTDARLAIFVSCAHS